MYMESNYELCVRGLQTNGKNNVDTVIFLPRFTCLPTRYAPIEISSKVTAGPLAIGDPQLTLSHVK